MDSLWGETPFPDPGGEVRFIDGGQKSSGTQFEKETGEGFLFPTFSGSIPTHVQYLFLWQCLGKVFFRDLSLMAVRVSLSPIQLAVPTLTYIDSSWKEVDCSKRKFIAADSPINSVNLKKPLIRR